MGKGKAKIEIERIESLQFRNQTFTKRRKGLFKKANELAARFAGTRIVAVVFSPAGNPFVFDPHAIISGGDGEETMLVSSKIEDLVEQITGKIGYDKSAPLNGEGTSANPGSIAMDSKVESALLSEEGPSANLGSIAMDSKIESFLLNEAGTSAKLGSIAMDSKIESFLLNGEGTSGNLGSIAMDSNFDFEYDGLDAENFANQFLNQGELLSIEWPD